MAAKVGSGSKGRYRLNQNAEINVTPFVDVMLVLLIIFMVSVPMATLATKIDLPPVSFEQAKDPTYISVTRQGLYVSGTATTLPQLSGELTRHFAVAQPQQETVMIRTDRDVPYAQFMAVVNQLQADGFYKIGLIAEEAPDAA